MWRNIVRAMLAVVLALVLFGDALAMTSSGYGLEWYIPLTGSGGGPSASASYAVDFTIGQTAVGNSASSGYAVGLGYWQGAWFLRLIHLPLILRN